MDIKPGTTSGGTDRYSPQRGQGGYSSRQATYYSSARPPVPVQSELNSGSLTLEQSAEAAQRIVLPKPTPIVNYAGSFDMLAPVKPAQNIQPPLAPLSIEQEPVTTEPVPTPVQFTTPVIPVAFSLAQPAPIAPSIEQEPVVPEATPALAQSITPEQPVDYSPILPTDLSLQFTPITEGQNVENSSKIKFGLPKLSTPKVLVGMAVCLFVAGVSISVLSLRTNKAVIAQVKGDRTNTANTDDDGGMTEGIPHEDGNPPSVEYYKTAATYPRVIRIAKTETEARVLALAIAPTGALKAPGNIFDAGWYKDSARPGEAGAMVVDGHVSGPTKPGVFKNLGKLVKGDKIEIERGDGQRFTYTVQATKVFDADKLDMSSVMVPVVPGKPGLNIITCGGKFDKATNKYEQRTVVYAVL